ncbi:MAG: VTT domain-containing protein [Acidobacteriia bacterium]|nr:VTT domain-containing protein [Terriglobia bacterium]
MLTRITTVLVAYGLLGVFFLGLIDSIGVPLPATMDALIIVIAVKSPERAYLAAALGVLGSVAGNVALFEMARFGVRRFVREVTEPGKTGKFRRWFHRYGLLTVFLPAATPVLPLPLKFFVISAGVLHSPRARFVVVVFLARLLRYFGDAYLGVKLGEGATDFLRRNAWTLVGLAIAGAGVLYVLLRWSDRRRNSALTI